MVSYHIRVGMTDVESRYHYKLIGTCMTGELTFRRCLPIFSQLLFREVLFRVLLGT
jgi:hypothetical protein